MAEQHRYQGACLARAEQRRPDVRVEASAVQPKKPGDQADRQRKAEHLRTQRDQERRRRAIRAIWSAQGADC